MIKHTIKGWLQLARPPIDARKYEKIEFEQSVKYAIEVIEKEEKYRWHDLKEHPEDVPDTRRFVEVRTEDLFPYYFGWYDCESEFGSWYDAAGFSMQPVKWREIEEDVNG